MASSSFEPLQRQLLKIQKLNCCSGADEKGEKSSSDTEQESVASCSSPVNMSTTPFPRAWSRSAMEFVVQHCCYPENYLNEQACCCSREGSQSSICRKTIDDSTWSCLCSEYKLHICLATGRIQNWTAYPVACSTLQQGLAKQFSD